jgi:Uma2 family endonuclease
MIPMKTGSTNQNRIALNLSAALNFAFKHQDYEVFMSSVRLFIPQKNIFTFPDVMVVADTPEYDSQSADTMTNPQVVADILSESPQGDYREDKFEAYRAIPSFQEYLLIDSTKIHVQHFFKKGEKQWGIYEYDQGNEVINFSSINFKIAVEDLYNKVKFDTSTAMNRWWNPNYRDWITLGEGEIADAQLLEWGYTNKTFQKVYGLKSKPENGVAVHRWWHENDGDWITLADGEITDENLIDWGYGNKTFQFYAFQSQPILPNNTAPVYRWWNETDRDWITLAEGEIGDEQLLDWGYAKKTLQFYLPFEKNPNQILDFGF